MWEAKERLQQGESLSIQDVKTNLFWEFVKFTSHDEETMESYYTRFYKHEMSRNNLTVTTMQVNVQFLQQLQPEWSRNANPLALVATAQASQDPFYQSSRSHRSSAPSPKSSIPSRSHTSTRHKGKEIAKPITPPSETASEEDSDLEQAQRDKDMQKNLALIAKYFKKIYKPTNNNLRTSSNSKKKNVDTNLRYKNDDHSGQFGTQRTLNVAGTREKVGSQVVQKTGIQCFNCKEYGHFAKECKKPKRVKDSAYHKEKMLLCKQAEQGIPLHAEQYYWLANTDEEVDEQELEVHYLYMAKIQEVPNANSGTDSEPVEQNSFYCPPDSYHPPHPTYETYSGDTCGNDSHFGYDCSPQFPLNYEPEPRYSQNYISYPYDSPSFPQQYPCCEDCGKYTVNHPIFSAHHDLLGSQKKLNMTLTKNLEEKQLEEEKAAKAQSWKLPVCYDDDDDEESSNSLEDNIISELPLYSAVTPSEPVDSLSMRDEHLDTISTTESDEFIKSYVENLVPNASESEGENGCDVPSCFTTFSNILFDADYDFESVDDQSLHNKDVSEKIFSNSLFEEEIISIRIDQHHFNVESDLVESMLNRNSYVISHSSKIDSLLDEFVGELTLLKSIPPGIDKADCHPENEIRLSQRLFMGDEHLDTIPATESDEFIKSSVENPVPNPSESEGETGCDFAGELTLLKSIPPRVDETDCYPENEIRLSQRLLYDNSSPRPPEEFNSENSNAEIESFSPSPIPDEDSDSFMEEIDLFLTPNDPMPPSIEDDEDSEGDILFERLLHDDPIPFPNTLDFSYEVIIFLPFFTYPYSQKLEDSCQRILSSKS
nr:hypothetical protein [Tanacetum cinerariifolium]